MALEPEKIQLARPINLLQEQEAERAGRPRGDSPNAPRPAARSREQIPYGSAAQALQTDLGSLRRIANDAGGLRPDGRRDRSNGTRACLRPSCER